MVEEIRRLSEVKIMTGLGASTIHSMVAKGAFPKPIKLGSRATGWVLSEVTEWIEDKIATSRID